MARLLVASYLSAADVVRVLEGEEALTDVLETVYTKNGA
jgi:hypothetical protein